MWTELIYEEVCAYFFLFFTIALLISTNECDNVIIMTFGKCYKKYYSIKINMLLEHYTHEDLTPKAFVVLLPF